MLGASALVFGLLGCGGPEPTETTGGPEPVETTGGLEDSTDQMFDKHVDGAEFYVFQIDGKTMTADGYRYEVGLMGEPLDDGFYKVVADVTYLNGGIAGYVNYPQIEYVQSCEEVSPLEIDLPALDKKSHGLMRIGDYADADVLLAGYDTIAVWKDGSWAYRYDTALELSDGTVAYVREGVSEDDVRAGQQDGVLLCEDYFILPNE